MRRLTALLLVLLIAPVSEAAAQLSGGSFGGSRGWGGSSSSGSSSSGSSWGGSSSGSSWGGSSSGSSWSEQNRRRREEERRQREEERRRREEEARRREEEARRRAEEARRRREAAQLAADRALAPAARARLARRFETGFVELPSGGRPLPRPTRFERPAPSVARPPGPALPPAPALMPARPVALQPSWALGAAAGAVAFLVLALLGWGVRALRAATRSIGRRLGESTKAAAPRGSCEVRRLSIALDWTARARIQRGLEQLAGRHDLSTARGMHAAAAAAADLLRASLGAVRYACWQRLPVSSSQAEGRFRSLVADLKSRFRVDVVRGDRAPGSLQARAEEGEGLVVVSLVLGATAPLPALPGRLGPATLAQALGQLHTVAPRDLVALEVVWSPALERDRMSSLELERLYPELLRLGAGVGATACHYCQAVHAAELPRCPACGAPTRPAAPAAPSPRRA